MREPEAPLTEGVACERTYQVVVGGEPKSLLCRWFVPEPHPKGDWDCRVEIIWPDGRVQKTHGCGVDSAQALILALDTVVTRLLHSDESIYWFDEHDDLGLPHKPYHADQIAERKASFENVGKSVPPAVSEC